MFFQILYAFSPYGLRLHFLATGRTTTGCLPFLVGRKPFPESAAQGRSEGCTAPLLDVVNGFADPARLRLSEEPAASSAGCRASLAEQPTMTTLCI